MPNLPMLASTIICVGGERLEPYGPENKAATQLISTRRSRRLTHLQAEFAKMLNGGVICRRAERDQHHLACR